LITAAQRNARAALDAVRPAVARLSTSRGSEDLAADLIEMWAAVEGALRALVGSTVLSGQALIREARQRQALNFDQANALAEFQAVSDRLQDTAYRPTESDVNAARVAVTKLDAALTDEPATAAPAPADRTAAPAAAGSAAPAPSPTAAAVRVRRAIPMWAQVAIGVVILLALAGGAYAMLGRGSGGSLKQGVDAYAHGQREVAVSAFNKAVREDPKAALPHIYLARMDREVGNFTLASQELQLALQAEPANALALREMGSNLLAQNNYELARRFYVRSLQTDPTDRTAQGYLGCTLMKLGRSQEATSFLGRAGQGPWSNCTAAPAAPGVLPPAPGALTGTAPRP
jgi:tetratricopeptide (TPR) repeat protein